ncbi:MAG: DNA polymerase III subunit beta [Chloroflexi bacterium]|nr:DNA polymerase III subunit beta [Chloroflexota bacterium]
MKVSCMQANLARGLSVVGRAVATRSTLPVLSNILLSTEESRLKLSATNLEIGINCWIPAKVEREGATTIPARLLSDFVNSLSGEKVDMELIARTQTLHVRCDRSEANIKGIDAQEYPLILVPDEDEPIRIGTDELQQMIDRVAFAAATDESRPVLTGVQAELGPESFTFAAADSYRLSVSSMPLDRGPETQMSVIIPARALQELRRISSDEDSVEVRVAGNRNQIFFHLDSVDLVSQLVEGSFPDYKQIIPQSHNTRTVVSTGEFLKAVRIAAIFARDSANICQIHVAPNGTAGYGRLIVSATSQEHGDNVSELDARVEGPPIDIAFNARYLQEALGVIDTAEVALETRDPTNPGVIRPVGGGDFTHIIMPMQVAR